MTDSLGENFTVTTDKGDYQPGETAVFTASNVDAGATVEFSVAHVNAGADGIYGTEDDLYTYDLSGTGITWSVTDGGDGDLDGTANGVIATSWYVNWDALGQSFVLSANSGSEMATANFTDANPHLPVDAVPDSLANGLVILTGDEDTATGTGIFPSFVQIQGDKEDGGTDYDNDNDSSTEEGFNTDAAPVLDTDSSAQHNHSLLFSAVPIVELDGQNYYEFRLDLNDGGDTDISLDSFKLYYAPTGNLTDLSGATLIYNMDDAVNVSIDLTAWASGSGHSDYKFLIPEHFFTDLMGVDPGDLDPTDFIYLYSAFSDANSGFEEWSVGPPSDDGGGGNGPGAELEVIKDTVCIDGDADQHSIDGSVVLAGSDIAWTYTLHSLVDGTWIYDITLADDPIGVIWSEGVADPNGDLLALGYTVDLVKTGGDLDNLLEQGEEWVFTVSGASAIAGEYLNTAHATGTGANGTPEEDAAVEDFSETNSYFGVNPAITVDKVTTGYVTPTTQDTGDSLNFLAGYTITWTVTVENTGNVDLVNVQVVDTPFGNIYLSGDTNQDWIHDAGEDWSADGDAGNDGVMSFGEVWTFTADGTAIFGSYSNTANVTADTYIDGEVVTEDACENSLQATGSDDSGYTGIFIESGMAWTQGFWANHLEAWNPDATTDNRVWTQLVPNVLRATDINPNADGKVLLGDVDGDGVIDAGESTITLTFDQAKAILTNAAGGDARLIMLAQAVAAQLNIYNGGIPPTGLMEDAVTWLKTLPSSIFADGVLSAGEYSISSKGVISLTGSNLAANKTSGAPWMNYTDVISGTPSWEFDGSGTPGIQQANGEGIKNALMWWNDGHLVTSASNQVGWDSDGVGGSTVVSNINLNDLDHFWLTLHQTDIGGGGSINLVGIL